MKEEISILDKFLSNELEEDLDLEYNDEFGNDLDHSSNLVFNHLLRDQINDNYQADLIVKNYLFLLNNKFEYLKVKYNGDEEFISLLNNAWKELLLNLLEKFQDKFDIDFSEQYLSNLENIGTRNLDTLMNGFYEFTIIDKLENVIRFIVRYISDNRQEFANEYKASMENRKNVSLASLKKTFKFNDAIILYFLNEIVTEILSSEIPFKDFISIIELENEGDINNAIVKNLITEDDTNFFKSLTEVYIDKTDFFDHLLEKVRIRIVEIFKN